MHLPDHWKKLFGAFAVLVSVGLIFSVLVLASLSFPKLVFSGQGLVGIIFLGAIAIVVGKRNERRGVRYSLYLTSASFFLAPLTAFLIIAVFFNPFTDDGPFEGIARKHCPSSVPQQIFKINLGRTIEVHEQTDRDRAPTVALRGKNDTIIWCVFATGYDHSYVSKLSFSSFSESYFSKKVTLRGSVIWTYGHEAMTWEIKEDNSFAYWYAW